MARGDVRVVITGDASGLSQAFGQSERAASTFSDKMSGLGNNVAKFGDRMSLFASLPIAGGLLAATNAASDLNEAVNVTGLVFEDSRGKIDEFVKTTAEGLGQSERAAREATATFGGLLKNLGLNTDETVDWSIKLTRLASDLGSAFNAEPAEAVQALGSALRGETEPIRRFNVMLDDATVRTKAVEMGLAGSTAEVDKAGKAQATLALIMEQTSDVQNDFANTSDGLANQQRILKARLEDTAAQLGTKLLPIANKVVGAALGMVEGFGELDPALQNAAIAGGAFVAAIGPVASVGGRIIANLTGMVNAVKALAVSSNVAAVSAGGLGLALAGVGAAFVALNVVRSQFQQAARGLNDSLATTVNNQALLESGVKLGTDAIREQAREAYIAGAYHRGFSSDMEEVADAGREVAAQVGPATAVLRNLSEASGVSRERVAQLANEMGINLANATDEQRESLSSALSTIGAAVRPTERLAAASETLGNEFATAKEEADAFKEALDAALGTVLSADEATIQYRQRVLELAQEIAAGRKEGEGAQETNDRFRLGLIDIVEAAEREVEALAAAGQMSQNAGDKKQALIDRLNHLKTVFPALREEIDKYIFMLGMIPGEVTTRLNLIPNADIAALGQSGAAEGAAAHFGGVTVNVDVDARGIQDPEAVGAAVSRHVGWQMGGWGGSN